jgi:uncharacterized membrane protein (DUF2068 family)
LRTLALFEAAKGMLVLLVGCGLSSVLHHRARHTVEMLVNHFHLNPAHHTPLVFMKLAERFDNTKLWLLAGGAAAYAIIRFAEAYGLWYGRRWAEWLGCVGAAFYIPLEYRHFVVHPGLVSTIVLSTNVIIVVYLAVCLWKGRRRKGYGDAVRSDRDADFDEDGAVSRDPADADSKAGDSGAGDD